VGQTGLGGIPLMGNSLRELQETSRWLLKKASNVTTEGGEDGIISAALDLLPERNGWCIEFGAWDGRKMSNTYNLISSRGYRGVFIEANPARFHELQQTHDAAKNILINAFVGFDEDDCLDALLQEHVSIPRDVDLLSIDIDGNDYHAWAAIRSFRPKLVLVEYNPTLANAVHFAQEKDPETNHGSSAAALVHLAHSKSYELIAVTAYNLLFVDSKYYPLFDIPDNSLEVMRDDSGVPHIFVGYDGKVFLSERGTLGSISLPWHGVKLPESAVQGLPKRLQKYPRASYSPTDKSIFFIYRRYFGLQRLKGRSQYYLESLRRVLRGAFHLR
jgi:hypothetical protein